MGIILSFPPGKRAPDIKGEIERRIRAGEFDTFIYIVPTRRKIRELRRGLLEFTNNGVMPEINIFTLDLFARKLYYSAKLEKPKRLISDTIQSLLFQTAVEDIIDELVYFRPPGQAGQKELPRGTLNRIIDTIIGLKEDGIYPTKLYEEIERVEKIEDRMKLQDLVKIYERYEGFLIGNGFIDVPGIFKELNDILNWENVNSIFRGAFYNVDLVFIEGFSMFRLPETNLIKILTKVHDLSVVIFFDYFEKNNNLFGHLDECYNRFVEAGFKRYEIRPKTENDKFARHLNKYLFNYIGSNFKSKYDAKEYVTLIEASDRIDEVRTIARVIKKIVNERPDIDLSKICVATYRPEKYTSLFREIFTIYGIPANITDRFYLERSPLVSSVISLLEIPINDYRVSEIIKVLLSPYFDFSSVVGRELKAENIYLASKELKIKGGKETWYEKVKRRIEIINSKLEITNDQDEYEQLRKEKEVFESAFADFNDLMVKVVDKFDKPMTPSEFRDSLHGILSDLKVNEQILKVPRRIATQDEIERDARAYQKFIEVVDELLEVFEFNMMRRGKYSLKYYVDLIKKALPRVRYNIRQKFGYGVYVTTLEETRGLNFDVMIIAGLVDTEFPSVYEPEVFLSEGLRKTKKMHKLDERYLFYQGAVNFKSHLYLTYPKTDNDNELVRSRFIDSLEQVIDFEIVDSSVFKDWIYSMDELYERYGRFLKFNLENLNAFDFIEQKFPKLVQSYAIGLKRVFDISKINISRSETHEEIYLEYEGVVKPSYEEEKRKLGEHEERVFSISQIETYGKCPYRYFVERVLGLKKFEEIEELLTPIERGILYHEVLYEFYTRWRETGKLVRDDFEGALSLIKRIAKEKAKEFEISHPLWEIEKRDLERSVESFIKNEKEMHLDFKPTYFEVAFGPKVGARKSSDKELSINDPIQLGRVKIQGKIDRIDIADGEFIIYDYKTGSANVTQEQIERGIHLQIPLYIKIAEEVFKLKNREMEGIGGYNYIVRREVKNKAVLIQEKIKRRERSSCFDREIFRQKIDEAVDKANQFVNGIIEGRFNLTEHDEFLQSICGNCPYIEICRVNEVKFGVQIKNWD